MNELKRESNHWGNLFRQIELLRRLDARVPHNGRDLFDGEPFARRPHKLSVLASPRRKAMP